MILQYEYLSRHPRVFRVMTGLNVEEFDALVADLEAPYAEAEPRRLQRPNRQRAIGAGRLFQWSFRDRLLATVVWLRRYPTEEALGYFFGVSDSSARRAVEHLLPLLEATGRDTMRMPDPGKACRKSVDALLQETPELAVIVDSFEQRVQRPRDRQTADGFYSGKKKQHTLKSQIAVDETTGRIVDVSESVPGPTADLKLLEESKLMERLPEGVGALGDLAYVGIDKLHPSRRGATPRRKPRGKPRPAEDIDYNRAFSRRRIGVEHRIGRLRGFRALAETDRHHRQHHGRRVRAVAGLVNRQLG